MFPAKILLAIFVLVTMLYLFTVSSRLGKDRPGRTRMRLLMALLAVLFFFFLKKVL